MSAKSSRSTQPDCLLPAPYPTPRERSAQRPLLRDIQLRSVTSVLSPNFIHTPPRLPHNRCPREPPMDWTAAIIDKNREALKGILAGLLAMVALSGAP